MVLGTPRYMSPEQISGQPVDQRSDLFSLGIVLYEMLTGKRLFAGSEMAQVMHSITNDEHLPPTQVNPALPAMLDFVVARALKKDPKARYQDADDLAADLRTCLAELRHLEEVSGESGEASEGSKTLKLEALADKAPDAPAARAILVDTRLPLSRQFDSSDALRRLGKSPRLGRAPRPVGFFRRLLADHTVRLFFLASALGALAGAAIALG
jgi:serine/threonine-protein kinase